MHLKLARMNSQLLILLTENWYFSEKTNLIHRKLVFVQNSHSDFLNEFFFRKTLWC